MVIKRDLIIIALIYIITIISAYLLIQALPFTSLITKVIIADIVATIMIFIASTVFKNSSIYDPYWSIAPLVMLLPFIQVFNIKTVLLVCIIYLWGIRLTINWIKTFKGLKFQDWRYDHFKVKSGKFWPLVNLFGIHLMPTIVVLLAMIPSFLMLQSKQSPNAFIYIGAMLGLSAIIIQSIADHQMHAFKKHGIKEVLNTGLWRYSRHPNYLGEILLWFSVFIMMSSVIFIPSASFGAILNLSMFIIISIPLMEKRQLNRRIEYALYQEKTPMLIPWPFGKFSTQNEALNSQ